MGPVKKRKTLWYLHILLDTREIKTNFFEWHLNEEWPSSLLKMADFLGIWQENTLTVFPS